MHTRLECHCQILQTAQVRKHITIGFPVQEILYSLRLYVWDLKLPKQESRVKSHIQWVPGDSNPGKLCILICEDRESRPWVGN